jgi:hypothetical protein
MRMRITWVYTYRLRICNSYYFRTATMITRTRHNVTLYVHCLYCWCYLRHGWWAKLKQKLLPGDLKQFKLKFKLVLCVNHSFHLVVFESVLMPLSVPYLLPFSSLNFFRGTQNIPHTSLTARFNFISLMTWLLFLRKGYRGIKLRKHGAILDILAHSKFLL